MAAVIIGPFQVAYSARVPIGKNGPTALKRRCFPRALVVSPERTAGQTACPTNYRRARETSVENGVVITGSG